MGGVVLRMARTDGAGESQAILFVEPVIADRSVGEETVGISERAGDELRQAFGCIAVCVDGKAGEFQAVQPVAAPLKWAHDAVCIARGELVLPPLHPMGVRTFHVLRYLVYQR